MQQTAVRGPLIAGIVATLAGVSLYPHMHAPLAGAHALAAGGTATVRPDRTARSRIPATAGRHGRNLAGRDEALRPNMFTAPQATTAGPSRGSMTIAQLGPGPMVTSLPVEDPLSDAVYAGYITVDGRTRALIESRSTRQGEYLDAGATWHDYRIVAITPRQVTVSVNGQACILPISDAFNAVPLTASAPGSLRDGADAIGAQVVAVGGEAAMSQDAVTAYSEEIRSAAMSLEQSTLALDLDIQMSDQMATVDSPAIELGVQVINDFD